MTLSAFAPTLYQRTEDRGQRTGQRTEDGGQKPVQRVESPLSSVLCPLSSTPGVGIRVILDVPYAEAGGPRQKLDLYLPDRRNFPVVVFVHGGAWVSGDKAFYS